MKAIGILLGLLVIAMAIASCAQLFPTPTATPEVVGTAYVVLQYEGFYDRARDMVSFHLDYREGRSEILGWTTTVVRDGEHYRLESEPTFVLKNLTDRRLEFRWACSGDCDLPLAWVPFDFDIAEDLGHEDGWELLPNQSTIWRMVLVDLPTLEKSSDLERAIRYAVAGFKALQEEGVLHIETHPYGFTPMPIATP